MLTMASQQVTSVSRVEITDGKVSKNISVPKGFDSVSINITSNIPSSKGPYWCDIVNADGTIFTTLAITPESNMITTLPAPSSKELHVSMERVSDLLRTTYVYVSFTFFNKQSSNSKVSFDSNSPLPVSIRQPLWTTNNPRPYQIAQPEMSGSNLIDIATAVDDIIRKDVQHLLNNQEVVVNKTYGTSLVAVVIQENAKTLYSINYTHKQGLDFSFDVISKHKKVLQRNCPPELILRNLSVINLEIGPDYITKLQALYEFKLAKPEMNVGEEEIPMDDLFYHEFSPFDDKESWLWEEICSMCGWEGIEHHRYRDNRLMVLLRKRIGNCKCSNGRQSFMPMRMGRIIKSAKPEMDNGDTAAALTDGERKVETSNIVLSETQEVSSDQAAKPALLQSYRYCSTEFNPQYGHLTDRDLFWKSFTWSTENQPENTRLIDTVLPLDFINSRGKSYCKTPNFMPFNIHTYMNFDQMTIRLHVNSNQFQSGGLIAAWLYASDSYFNKGPRSANVASLFQRPHVIVSAGSSNEATLVVPYKRTTAFMRTKNYFGNTTAKMSALNIGRLVICPIVPLRTGPSSTAPKTCNVSIFVGFKDAHFTGLVDGELAKPEMNAVGTIIGKSLGVVDKIIGDLNCDNPPSTRPPQFFVPINSCSWAHGTNAYEPINTLRLDGGRIGMHRKTDSSFSETRIPEIMSVFGMLKPINWNSQDAEQNSSGHLLWGMGVHPQCDKDRLYVSPVPGLLDSYTLPPVSVLASCMALWRGSLQFKFQFFATSKHTARILCAYIPGVPDYSKITLEQAKSSAHVEFSLNDETNAFTFVVPYIADTEWWQRRYGGAQRASDFIAPSSIVMFVLNPLVPMESVSPIITIIPSIAAARDFEMSILSQPAIGLSLNRVNIIPDQDKVQFKEGYYPVYAGEWHSFMSGTKAILRYGNTSDHIAQLTTPPPPPSGSAYYWTPVAPGPKGTFKTSVKGGTDPATGTVIRPLPAGDYEVGYGVIIADGGYYYMIPIPRSNNADDQAEDIAKAIALTYAQKRSLDTIKDIIPDYISDSEYIAPGNITWEPRAVAIPAKARPEMESERTIAPNVLLPTNTLPTTLDGVLSFGEKFNDIKDWCRRYQLYWEGTVSPGQVRDNKRNAAFVQIPMLPQGLSLIPTLENPVWNSMREGIIPVLSSGFRFYNGGMRLRIVVTGLNDSIWVQHHPDRQFTKAVPTIGKNIHDKDAYRNHGYAFHVQNLSVNRTIEIEVPWYKRNVKNLLGDPAQDFDSKEYSSLGDIVIGLEGDQPVDAPIDIAVYYCIADDCAFSTFVGFPDMVFCDEVFKENPPVRATPEMDIDESDFEFVPVPETNAVPEMMGFSSSAASFLSTATSSVIGSVIGNAATKGTAIVTKPLINVVKAEVTRNITPVLRDIESQVKLASEGMEKSIGRTIPEQAMISAIGQFSQVALNPTPGAIAVAIGTMLGQFVMITVELLVSIQNLLTEFLQKTWCRYFARSSDLQSDSRSGQPEGFFDDAQDKELNGILGLIFTAVATTVGLSISPPKQFPNIMKGVKESLNVCNSAVTFFRNIVDSVKYMYKYCLGETDEILRAKIIIEREAPHMKDWFDEVHKLLDPRNIHKIRHSTRHANRVFEACMYGAELLREGLDKNVPGNKIIFDLYTKICKVRDDLIELGNHPDVRFEPFPIWVSGTPGVGKSHMTDDLCAAMLREINYETKECMIYWLTLGQKYWNGCGNNPVIARDEAYAVSGQFTEEEIATHLAICSCSILNPPMAALSEKNKRLNPLIYWLNSNVEFPHIAEARCPEAIYRRRAIMIRAEFTPEILAKYPHLLSAKELPESEIANYKHAQFRVADNPRDPNTKWSEPKDFAYIKKLMCESFKAHILKERANFKHRMRTAYCLDPDYDDNDELLYTDGETLSEQTLHEKFLESKRIARERLYAEPPNIDGEDTYMNGILNRFSYLWTPPANPQPEMDDEEYEVCPEDGSHCSKMSDDKLSKSQWFKMKQKEDKIMIESITRLEPGACFKLVSGEVEYTEEEIVNFTISKTFSDLVKKRKIRTAFGLFMKGESMLPDWMSVMWSEIAYKDIKGSWRDYGDKIPEHWENLTGVDAIRSYVYWMMREWQFKAFTEKMLETHSFSEIINAFIKAERDPRILCIYNKLFSNITSLDDIIRAVSELDNLIWTGDHIQKSIAIVYVVANIMSAVVKKNPRDFCDHCRFWVQHLNNTEHLSYSSRYDTISYKNQLGLPVNFKAYCTCSNSVTNSRIFKNSMRIVWNHDHGTTGNENTNPFAFAEHRESQAQAEHWLANAVQWAKEWWRYVAMPFVSQVLTFIYEHFGKIILILAGLYGLYNLYNSRMVQENVVPSATQAYEKASEVTIATRDKLIGAAVSVGLIAQDITPEPPKAAGESSYMKGEKPKAARAAPQPAQRESSGILDPMGIIEKKLQNNFVFITCTFNIINSRGESETREIHGRCLALRSRQILVIRHYLEEMKTRQGARFSITYCVNGKAGWGFLPREFVDNVRYFKVNGKEGMSNFGVLELPAFVPMFKDILSSIATKAEHNNVAFQGHLITCDRETTKVSRRSNMYLRAKQHLRIDGNDEVLPIGLDICYEYCARGAGMCGTVLVCENVCRGNPGIVGIHVAGLDGNGFAEPIHREMFEDKTLVPKYTFKMPELGPIEDANVELDTNLLLYGTVEKKYAHRESGKSKIVPSLLHGKVYPVLTEPNPLRANDPRQPPGSDPLRDGCNKHGTGYSMPFGQGLLDIVSHDNRQVLLNQVQKPLAELRELTLQEAICGSIAIPHCEALNWNSSEGYPLSAMRPPDAHNKKYLFDLEETNEGYVLKGMNETLVKIFDMRKRLREADVVFPTIYIDCLKDYRLPFEKCKIPGKTRIFSIAPVQTTIDLRRYMGLFLSGYKQACVVAQHGIGINVDSTQWTKLAHYLLEVGNNIVTGDYANYGPTLSSQIVQSVNDDIVYWHRMNGASDEHILHLQHILDNEILNPWHLCGNMVYQTINGIASGSPITTELNSEIGKKYIKLAFLILSRKLGYKYSMADFNLKIRLVTYGDDFIMSVHDDFIEWFNCRTISETLADYGITLTDVEKGETITPSRSLLASKFLKRGFQPHPTISNLFLAPIEEQSITECLNWCHKQTDMKAATEEVIRASCILAFGKGPEYYRRHVEKIHVAAIHAGLKAEYPSWEELNTNNFG